MGVVTALSLLSLADCASTIAGEDNASGGEPSSSSGGVIIPGVDASLGSSSGGTGLLCSLAGSLCTDATTAEAEDCGSSVTVKIKSVKPRITSFAPMADTTSSSCTAVVQWSDPDAGDGAIDAWTPPPVQNYSCPAGTVRIHIRDMWSNLASPTLNTITGRPLAVTLTVPSGIWPVYWASEDSAGCDWYSICAPSTLTSFEIGAVGASNACSGSNSSGLFDTSSFASATDIWIEYAGSSSTLQSDYNKSPVPVSASAFRVTTDGTGLDTCSPDAGVPPTPTGFIKLHFRYPWGDPTKTGFAGTNCDTQLDNLTTPPYPTTLMLQNVPNCNQIQGTLDFQDGNCPWYTALIPTSAWGKDGGGSIQIKTPDGKLMTGGFALPPPPASGEVWLAYSGPPDQTGEGVACENYSTRGDQMHFYSSNPGPGYANCGGGATTIDPCNPPDPTGYSTVHFRYLWAGQKTFTFFPDPQFMPKWIMLSVNAPGVSVDGGVSSGGSADEVICTREADRPWFNCPVQNSDFVSGATWIAHDLVRQPTEWNTVQGRPFPTTPGEYWIRWNYGKPDVDGIYAPSDVGPGTNTTIPTFQTFSYYPDGSGGDWSATGNWNDSACAPKPPPTPPTCGYQGWFPYAATTYAYPFGGSLANTYTNASEVQDLLNTFICQRYEIWKTNYLETSDTVCGAGTARVRTDPPKTVSEGQGYGIAISAAIGDKPTFAALWNFVRHFLSEAADKYCGGLMGWMWDGTIPCRAADSPCDPAVETCSGNEDSAFDGDVDIGIGLVFAAMQWPEFVPDATNWILKMECEVNSVYDGQFNYPTPGDTWDKNCQNYPGQPCGYQAGNDGQVNMSYYPPGYFRVFGDFLASHLDPSTSTPVQIQGHQTFWYKTAQTVYEMLERCYDQTGVDPGLVQDWGRYDTPCSISGGDYDWSRSLWRVGIDAAWFGNRVDLPENAPNSSPHYPGKTRMQAKIDNIQNFYNNFYVNNPPEPNANRFSTICQFLTPAGTVTGCDPGYGHNSYFVNTAMTAYASVFDNGGLTTWDIRKAALEEAVSTTVENDKYYQESIGVYTMLFLSGNFPNPLTVPTQ
jgi:endo-1,4-beta-D-glucanase Y